MRSAGLIGERAAFMRGLVADMATRWSPNAVKLVLVDNGDPKSPLA